MTIQVRGVGEVSFAELQARYAAYLSAGAPEPVIEGGGAERKRVLQMLAETGDAQMKSYVRYRLEGE